MVRIKLRNRICGALNVEKYIYLLLCNACRITKLFPSEGIPGVPLPPILASATVSVSTHLAMSLMSLITQSHLPKFHASS